MCVALGRVRARAGVVVVARASSLPASRPSSRGAVRPATSGWNPAKAPPLHRIAKSRTSAAQRLARHGAEKDGSCGG